MLLIPDETILREERHANIILFSEELYKKVCCLNNYTQFLAMYDFEAYFNRTRENERSWGKY